MRPESPDAAENYVKAIFRLGSETAEVKPTDLARHLKISNAAVTDMLRRLERKKLIRYVPYRSIHLTAHGSMLAVRTLRRHRLWELFLSSVVGVALSDVHSEAERLEHASSDELMNRIDELLGFPKFDPHGDPIPSRSGAIPARVRAVSLSATSAPIEGEIVGIRDRDPESVRAIERLGIAIGVFYRIVAPLKAGLMTIEISSGVHTLSREMAEKLLVTEAKEKKR